MEPTVHVRVIVLIIAAEGINDLPRFLGAGGAVEIDERIPPHLLVQDGEIGPHGLPVDAV